jgi:hypothetical protein
MGKYYVPQNIHDILNKIWYINWYVNTYQKKDWEENPD